MIVMNIMFYKKDAFLVFAWLEEIHLFCGDYCPLLLNKYHFLSFAQ